MTVYNVKHKKYCELVQAEYFFWNSNQPANDAQFFSLIRKQGVLKKNGNQE